MDRPAFELALFREVVGGDHDPAHPRARPQVATRHPAARSAPAGALALKTFRAAAAGIGASRPPPELVYRAGEVPVSV
jgi:hypothetical protein